MYNHKLIAINVTSHYHLPYETYLFEITPADEADLTSFKEFHHISEKYPFKILPFEN